MKTCKACNTTKELGDFYRHSNMKDGFLSKCIECCKTLQKERSKKPEAKARHAAASRKYQESAHGRSAHLKSNQSYREKNREIVRAHSRLNYAVANKKIVPQPCIACGQKAEAHHPDYSRPLDVVWLCKVHHEEVHHMVEVAA